MSVDKRTGEIRIEEDQKGGTFGMVQIAGKFLVDQTELDSGISNRYGHHKRLVRKS